MLTLIFILLLTIRLIQIPIVLPNANANTTIKIKTNIKTNAVDNIDTNTLKFYSLLFSRLTNFHIYFFLSLLCFSVCLCVSLSACHSVDYKLSLC